jgi:TIR domain/Effector-associated domain 7
MGQTDNLPSTADIRQMLLRSFRDEELTALCFDYFRDVYDTFATGTTKEQKIQFLIEHCVRRELVPNLLAAIERSRAEQHPVRVPPTRPEPTKYERDPKQVFISHAHEDAEFARRLAEDLQKKGWRVWIAPDSIQPGEKWAEAIERGLSESGVFIVALTPEAVRSRWVRDETFAATELEKEGHVLFVPLAVAPCEVPRLWRAYQRIPFQDNYEGGLAALLGTLEAERQTRLAAQEAERLERERQERQAQERETREEAERQVNIAAEEAPVGQAGQVRQEPQAPGRLPLRRLWPGLAIAAGALIAVALIALSVRQLFLATPTPTHTSTSTPTAAPTVTSTATPTPTATATLVPSHTPTASASPTATRTPTRTATRTLTATHTRTRTPTYTPTPTLTPTEKPDKPPKKTP